ncbi:GpE family phage tail protein [Novosphingobium sp. Leaf2]
MIAEIAAVFHWPLSELAAMPIDDLLDWRERAIAIWNRMHASKEGGS